MSVDLTYESLGHDGLAQVFNLAMEAVAANIDDPNTDPKAVRKVSVEIKIKPDEKRAFPQITYGVKPTLAAVRPVALTGMLVPGEKKGTVKLTIPEIGGTNPDQLELPIKVTKLPAKEAAHG